jgi:Protein of unknown function (DUF2408)
LGYSSKLASHVSPVDESLKNIEKELKANRDELKALRAERNREWLEQDTELDPEYHDKLRRIKGNLERVQEMQVDGKFLGPSGEVPSGQVLLKAVLFECWSLVHELSAYGN